MHCSGNRAGEASLPHTPKLGNGGSTVTLDRKPPPGSASDIVVEKQCAIARISGLRLSSIVESQEQPPSEQAQFDEVEGVPVLCLQPSSATDHAASAAEARPAFSSKTIAKSKEKAKLRGQGTECSQQVVAMEYGVSLSKMLQRG